MERILLGLNTNGVLQFTNWYCSCNMYSLHHQMEKISDRRVYWANYGYQRHTGSGKKRM